MNIEWTLEKKWIKELRGMPNNPRKLSRHDAQHLRKSLEKFGVCQPIVVNTDMTVVGGHQRLSVLKQLKVKEVECYVPSRTLTDVEVAELNIRLNRNQGEWDWDILANEIELISLLDWGFDPKELGHIEALDPLPEEEKEKAEKTCPHCGGKL